MNRPRTADDFATIRARMEKLRREREGTERAEKAKASEQIPVQVNCMGQVSIAIGEKRNG